MSTRRSDTFSRFYWVPSVLLGLVALALDLDLRVVLLLFLSSFAALLAFDRIWFQHRGAQTRDEP